MPFAVEVMTPAVYGFVPVAVVVRHRHPPGGRHSHLEQVEAAIGIVLAAQEPELQCSDADDLGRVAPVYCKADLRLIGSPPYDLALAQGKHPEAYSRRPRARPVELADI